MPEKESSGELVRWADEAMYEAAPVAGERSEDGNYYPVVTLVQMTRQPIRTMAAAAELYRGNAVVDPEDVDHESAMLWWEDMTRTRLKAPLEFIEFHFLIENVPRSFTHQLVRQRTAVYVQESQRFAVKEDESFEVRIPPSIAARERKDHGAREVWEHVVSVVAEAYGDLVNHYGIPAEEARGLLPTDILTKVHYHTNLRNLAEHAGNRLCTQAQFEWRLVWTGMIREIRLFAKRTGGSQWEHDAIADMFRPICYQTGKCEFMAETDRYCQIRERVENFHNYRRDVPSSDWSNNKWEHQAINPAEWLGMPGSARTRNPQWRSDLRPGSGGSSSG
jgi:flavin-dependent thymidylate synthase